MKQLSKLFGRIPILPELDLKTHWVTHVCYVHLEIVRQTFFPLPHSLFQKHKVDINSKNGQLFPTLTEISTVLLTPLCHQNSLSFSDRSTNTKKNMCNKGSGVQEARRMGYLVGTDRDLRAILAETCQILKLM